MDTVPGSQEELGFCQPLLSAVCNRFQLPPISAEPPLPQEEGISAARVWHSQSYKLKETTVPARAPLVLVPLTWSVSRRGRLLSQLLRLLRPRRWAYSMPLPSLKTQRWDGPMHSDDGLPDLLASNSPRNRSLGGTDECRVETLCYG